VNRFYSVDIPSEVQADLASIPPEPKRAIRAVLRQVEQTPDSGKKLVDELTGMWRLVAGNYRVVYRFDGRIIRIISIGHRGTVYELLAKKAKNLIAERRARYRRRKRTPR